MDKIKKFKIEKGRVFNHRDGMSELKIFEEQIKEKDMNDNKDFGLTNSGDNVVQVPTELKDHSKDPKLTDEQTERLKRHAAHEDATTKDVIGPMAISPELLVKTKKRGRPSKKHIGIDPAKEGSDATVKQWYCSTCKEYFDDKNVMKIGAGTNRWAVFCSMCQRSFGFQDQDMLDKVQSLIDHNPTGK